VSESEQTQEAEFQVHQESIQVISDTQNIIDIHITNITGSQQICHGERIDFIVTVKNNNSANIENIDLYYYISLEPTIQTSSHTIGATFVSLRPNEEQIVFDSFKQPEEYVEGKYYLGFIVDPYESLADLKRENNSYILEEQLTINPCKSIHVNNSNFQFLF